MKAINISLMDVERRAGSIYNSDLSCAYIDLPVDKRSDSSDMDQIKTRKLKSKKKHRKNTQPDCASSSPSSSSSSQYLGSPLPSYNQNDATTPRNSSDHHTPRQHHQSSSSSTDSDLLTHIGGEYTDRTSVTSSEWGDEVCEFERRESDRVNQLFQEIDTILFNDSGCFYQKSSGHQKSHRSNAPSDSMQQQNSSSSSSMIYQSSHNIAPIRRECMEWRRQFPHFRLIGTHIHNPNYHYHQHPSSRSLISNSILSSSSFSSVSKHCFQHQMSSLGFSFYAREALVDVSTPKNSPTSTPNDLVTCHDDDESEHHSVYLDKLSVTGRSIRINTPSESSMNSQSQFNQDDSSDYSSTNDWLEEIIEHDGEFVEIIAIDYKDDEDKLALQQPAVTHSSVIHQYNNNNKHRHSTVLHPPCTPNQELTNSILTVIFDNLWSRITHWISPSLYSSLLLTITQIRHNHQSDSPTNSITCDTPTRTPSHQHQQLLSYHSITPGIRRSNTNTSPDGSVYNPDHYFVKYPRQPQLHSKFSSSSSTSSSLVAMTPSSSATGFYNAAHTKLDNILKISSKTLQFREKSNLQSIPEKLPMSICNNPSYPIKFNNPSNQLTNNFSSLLLSRNILTAGSDTHNQLMRSHTPSSIINESSFIREETTSGKNGAGNHNSSSSTSSLHHKLSIVSNNATEAYYHNYPLLKKHFYQTDVLAPNNVLRGRALNNHVVGHTSNSPDLTRWSTLPPINHGNGTKLVTKHVSMSSRIGSAQFRNPNPPRHHFNHHHHNPTNTSINHHHHSENNRPCTSQTARSDVLLPTNKTGANNPIGHSIIAPIPSSSIIAGNLTPTNTSTVKKIGGLNLNIHGNSIGNNGGVDYPPHHHNHFSSSHHNPSHLGGLITTPSNNMATTTTSRNKHALYWKSQNSQNFPSQINRKTRQNYPFK